MPNFEAVEQLNQRLGKIGNLHADGRPILGLDSKELLRFALEVHKDALFIPAHIWTPWFGLFGSKSGFDSITEAYGDLASEIHAIETGLSSDPLMNRRLRQLDGITLTSHSDAHSPQKLGREATVIRSEPTYDAVVGAIKANDTRLVGTIEFFPEEGKYFYDGHRACGIRFAPQETIAHKSDCPVCGKPLTVGVCYRVGELGDRMADEVHLTKTVEYIVPLPEVVAEALRVKSVQSRRVMSTYSQLIACLGNEFSILRIVPIDAIRDVSPLIASAVVNIRSGNVYREPGFDGVFGTIRVTN
jgi:uncharacterized protein (TIGR00375 family)